MHPVWSGYFLMIWQKVWKSLTFDTEAINVTVCVHKQPHEMTLITSPAECDDKTAVCGGLQVKSWQERFA